MSTNAPQRPGRMARRQFAAVAMAILALSAGLLAADAKKPAVQLVIDYGDGVEVHFTALDWRDGMTVLDALAAAQAHKHGVAFAVRGSGDTALVTKIGDQKNEGSGKNWIYSVNDKVGEVSAGVCTLKPGDTVLWKFQKYDYNR